MTIEVLTPNLAKLAEHQAHPPGPQAEPPWPPRQALPVDSAAVPDLPPELLPDPLRPWLVDTATRASIPLSFVAVPAIVGLASVVGRSVGIRPEQFDSWTVIPNLWGGVVAPPGFLKSHAVAEGLAPLAPLQAAARERYEVDRVQAEAQQEVLRSQLAAMKRTKPTGPSLNRDDVAELLTSIEAAKAIQKRYRTSDATVEKLGELLKENPRGFLLSRDELAGWLRTLDKAERAGEREFFLESWNGTGSFTFDRIGRGTVDIPALCLSVVGGIQPAKLRSYILDAVGDGAGADGLLQRIQLLVWQEEAPPFHRPDRPPDHEAKAAAFEVYAALDDPHPVAMMGAEMDPHKGGDAPPFLRFDSDAQDLFDQWRQELEGRVRSPELARTPAFCSHLAKYRSLLPTIALLCDLGGRVAGTRPFAGGVNRESTARAASFCEFLEVHARKVYSHELAPGESAARLLATRLQEGDVHDGDSVRSIYRPQWSGLSTPETVWAGLASLEGLGWVRIEERQTGGRASDLVRIHPDLRGGG